MLPQVPVVVVNGYCIVSPEVGGWCPTDIFSHHSAELKMSMNSMNSVFIFLYY